MQRKKQKSQFFNKRFVEYCNSLEDSPRNYLYSRIQRECAVSKDVIYDWRCGRTAMNKLIRDKINEIAGEDIFGKEVSCE